MLTLLPLDFVKEEGTSAGHPCRLLRFVRFVRFVPLQSAQCSLWHVWIAIQGISAFGRTAMPTVFSERQQLAAKYLWSFKCRVLPRAHLPYLAISCHFTPLNRPRPSHVQSAMQSFWDVSRTQGLSLGSFDRHSWIILCHFIIHNLARLSASFSGGLKRWIQIPELDAWKLWDELHPCRDCK